MSDFDRDRSVADWASGRTTETEMMLAWEDIVGKAKRGILDRVKQRPADLTNFDWTGFKQAMEEYEQDENEGRSLSPSYATEQQVKEVIKRMKK